MIGFTKSALSPAPAGCFAFSVYPYFALARKKDTQRVEPDRQVKVSRRRRQNEAIDNHKKEQI